MPTPALVLLDLMLPDMSGLDVCQQLRADARTWSLPIVMTSSRVEESYRLTAAACGVDDFVTKPFSLRALTERCLELLRRAPCEPSRR
jgi:two-component system phosphate regulon response regulator PhoB